MSEPRKKPFEQPEVVSYEQDELVTETVFTAEAPTKANSHRNLKRHCRPVAAKRTLARLIRLL